MSLEMASRNIKPFMEQTLLKLLPPDFAQQAVVWGSKVVVSFLIFLGLRGRQPDRQEDHLPPGSSFGSAKGADSDSHWRYCADWPAPSLASPPSLGTLGINVSALVAGLGLTGFALGFAFRDALSNVLAGVMILLYHPFHRGDCANITGLSEEK